MQDEYVRKTKKELKRYRYAKKFVNYAENQIGQLETIKYGRLTSKYGLYSGGKSSGGEDDRIIKINAEIDELRQSYLYNLNIVEKVEYAFIGLSAKEKDITLKVHGYNKKGSKVKDLSKKYHYSRNQIYRIAKDGLKHISLKLYGTC